MADNKPSAETLIETFLPFNDSMVTYDSHTYPR